MTPSPVKNYILLFPCNRNSLLPGIYEVWRAPTNLASSLKTQINKPMSSTFLLAARGSCFSSCFFSWLIYAVKLAGTVVHLVLAALR